MKLRLISDFLDYYDREFSNSYYDKAFERLTKTSMNRWQMMRWLSRLGHKTPVHGMAAAVIPTASFCGEWVLHDDPTAHRGEGKRVVSDLEALAHPTSFVMPYFGGWCRGVSHRILQIGTLRFKMTYRSKDDWRSNCGDVEITDLKMLDPDRLGPWPLFAIDILPNDYAIDLNTAPGMTGTGMEEFLKPSEVFTHIAEWFEAQSNSA